ncbi:conserved hypothetical protein [Shewanella sediminis HAW-EB3]|uniref:Integral membrane bound transporter domain-containing protein n=2 Tax=Shewanella sediminis TaxID=271097 RepID=A8FUL1_SHESH|nr:conserved hypothetical protein [Shewanella sediminis HAW-EB3]
MMKLWHHTLSENDIRQCLRIATGAGIGFFLCKFFNWNYGVYFTVTPILLLGMIPKMTGHAARQCLASALVCGLEVGIFGGFFGGHPVLMSIIVFLLFLYKFACMSKGSLFLFGANGVLTLSIMLNFASYPTTDLNELIFTNIGASILSVMIAFAMTVLIPNIETDTGAIAEDKTKAQPEPQPLPQPKSGNQTRHEMLMGATIATLSFLMFQVFNLSDSMSAQATSVLLLYPMHWNGTLGYAKKRAMGTILGVVVSMIGLLFLYNWSGELELVLPLLWIGLMLCSYTHVKEGGGSGVGFGALTTLAILFGQNLTPENDFFFSALYRINSVLFAIVVTLLACYLIHRLLNSFEVTRYGQ